MSMLNYILILISILSIVVSIVLFSLYLRYLNLYRNLKTNFRSFLNFVDQHYIRKNDIYLHNATIEALRMAREKRRSFEIKAYEKLLERLKEGD